MSKSMKRSGIEPPKANMKKLHKKISSHLKEDVKGYQKQRKNLKKEIKEDRDLMRKVKGKKRG